MSKNLIDEFDEEFEEPKKPEGLMLMPLGLVKGGHEVPFVKYEYDVSATHTGYGKTQFIHIPKAGYIIHKEMSDEQIKIKWDALMTGTPVGFNIAPQSNDKGQVALFGAKETIVKPIKESKAKKAIKAAGFTEEVKNDDINYVPPVSDQVTAPRLSDVVTEFKQRTNGDTFESEAKITAEFFNASISDEAKQAADKFYTSLSPMSPRYPWNVPQEPYVHFEAEKESATSIGKGLGALFLSTVEKPRAWVAVDPGKAGAIVCLTNTDIVAKFIMPLSGKDIDTPALYNIFVGLKERYDLTVIIEDVHSIFGVSSKANFTFGYVCGLIDAVVIANQLRIVKTSPKQWQGEIWTNSDKCYKPLKPGQKKAQVDTKATSLKAALRLFPGADLRKSDRAKVPADGVTDALLMSEFGRRRNL